MSIDKKDISPIPTNVVSLGDWKTAKNEKVIGTVTLSDGRTRNHRSNSGLGGLGADGASIPNASHSQNNRR
jgi:hypothetical protein